MNELQRMQYLDAMGVDTFMPRWRLPGAKAPRQCDISFIPSRLTIVGAEQSAAPAPIPSATRQPAAVAQTLNSLLPVEADIGNVVEVSASTAADALSEDISFALSVWRISPQLMVIDSRQSQLALPTEGLLANILIALGYTAQALPRADVLRWPLTDNPYIGKSRNDAREWLETFFEARLGGQPADHLLVMGAQACEYVLPEDKSYAQRLADSEPVTLFNTRALVVPSLSEMLLDTSLKAQTWQIIQPLRRPAA